jgi:hypothetical protein
VKKLFLFVFAWIIAVTVFGQDSTQLYNNPHSSNDRKSAKRERINNMLRMEEEGDLIFNKHGLFGIKLATDGYGIFYERGKYKTSTRTFLYQIELNEKKDQKDHKVSAVGNNGFTFNSIVKGKLNNFYQLKLAVGQQHLIGGKGNKNGVAVTALYTGGVSIGMLKPYLVDVTTANSDSVFRSSYPTIIDSGYLEQGATGFFAGWGGLKIKPGLNAKAAMRFDYGRLNQTITAIEAGVTGEYFFGKIPMIAFVPQRSFFFNAYVSIMFGRRK